MAPSLDVSPGRQLKALGLTGADRWLRVVGAGSKVGFRAELRGWLGSSGKVPGMHGVVKGSGDAWGGCRVLGMHSVGDTT